MTDDELERAYAYQEEVTEELERRRAKLQACAQELQEKVITLESARKPARVSGKRGGYLKTRVAFVRTLERDCITLTQQRESLESEVRAAQERLEIIAEEIADIQRERSGEEE